MKTAERHRRGRSGDFIVKLKKKYTFLPFSVWISEFRMGGYFWKFVSLTGNLKKFQKELYWTFLELGTESLQIFGQRDWKYH